MLLLQRLGIAQPKVAIVAAVETVNPAIPATLDAQALVELSHQGAWPGAIVEGPFGFDNAISAEAARIKGIAPRVAGDADLLLMPDLNAGNMLYKSFNYIGGGDCALRSRWRCCHGDERTCLLSHPFQGFHVQVPLQRPAT